MAQNYALSGKNGDIYHLISPNTPQSDTSTGNLASVAPPSAPRSRYWARTFVLLLAPLGITAYYYWIWRFLLCRTLDDAAKYGSRTESWIFYSWFILGVFALEWSKHGLVGVEVAMLETTAFGAPHLVALLSHSEGTWSGPGGWLKCLTKAFQKNRSGEAPSLRLSLRTYKLWYILAFISLSLYIGMPLSGLTMELSDGYVRLDEAPMVVGRNSTNFHKRYSLSGETTTGAQNAWNMGSPATLPGIGIIFTPEYVNREDHEVLSDVPNSLPSSSGLPEMFIVPQALGPISGTAWGLRVGYDCSIAKDVSELTIIGHYTGLTSGDPSGPRSFAQSFTKSAVTNIWSYSEVGTTLNTTEPELPHKPHSIEQEMLTSIDSRADVLEWVVWQVRTDAAYVEVVNFNNTVGPTVQGLGSPFMKADNGSWVANETFFKDNDYAHRDGVMTKVWGELLRTSDKPFQPGEKNTIEVAEAIGVRCIVRSKLGSALVDAKTSSFAHFNAEDPIPWTDRELVNAEGPTARLGSLVRAMISEASLEKILTSINVRAMSSESNSVKVSKFVSSRDLQKSVYLAYGQEVLSNMYDNYYGFETSWPASNLTSSRKGKILTKGELPPLVALIPLGIWALGSLLLGVSYGFRRRLADSLSGFSFFRFGVYSADKLKDTGIFVAKDAEDVAKLWRLPGTLEKI